MTTSIFIRFCGIERSYFIRRRLWKKRGFGPADMRRGGRVRSFCPCELCRLDYGRLAYPRKLMREKAITLGRGRAYRAGNKLGWRKASRNLRRA